MGRLFSRATKGRHGKDLSEREQARALLNHLRWSLESTVERPADATYEFVCSDPKSGESLALEIKNLTWGEQIMRAASKRPTDPGYQEEIEFPFRGLYVEARNRLTKANEQLAKAKVNRRCVLLVWQYELPADLGFLQRAVGSLPRSEFPNIAEVWLTTAHAINFHRIELTN